MVAWCINRIGMDSTNHRTFKLTCGTHKLHLKNRALFTVKWGAWFALLFIVTPHTYNFYSLDLFQNLINKPMLNIDTSGIGTR